MKRRDFIWKTALLTTGAMVAPGCLNQNQKVEPQITEPEAPSNITTIDLKQWHDEGKTVHYTQEQIKQMMAEEQKIRITWPAHELNEPDCPILVDNWEGRIVYDGQVLISWDVPEEKEHRKTHHPFITGYPTIAGVAHLEHEVPISRSAVIRHPLWHENISPQSQWEGKLPTPPAGQRFHEIAPAPITEDPRDIRHCLYQKESEKLAYNILHWQPDILPNHPYPLSNNRFLLHSMATESALYDKIGPHQTRVAMRQDRIETADGIDKIRVREGSYAGMAQMGVNKRNNRLTGSITSTPFARGNRWAGFEVNGEPIDSKEDYLGDWQAQMLAMLYTQLSGYEYVDSILKRRKTDRKGEPISISGAFMMAHLRGPQAARNYLLRGRNATDGNRTSVGYYYEKFKGYDDLLFRPELDLVEQKALKVTPEGQALLDDIAFDVLSRKPLEPLPPRPQSFLELIERDSVSLDSAMIR